jgi:hypothetical protein
MPANVPQNNAAASRMHIVDPRELYPFVDDVMREDDALDPTLAGYQEDGSTVKAQ